jgi:hypothetical protein
MTLEGTKMANNVQPDMDLPGRAGFSRSGSVLEPTGSRGAPAARNHPRGFDRMRKAIAVLPLAAMALGQTPVLSQQPSAAPATQTSGAKPAAQSQQELDKLLAPIALYPDALIAQILMASTYPLEVVEAARWAKANPKLKDKALEDAMAKQSWDPSVKSLTSVPQVLKQMDENLSWTQKLGDAFLADQKAVLASVQGLRAKAAAAGNLKSTPEQAVKTEIQGSQTIYIIESPKPEVVYVPTYNPYTVYGPWPYPAPPYYMYPPAYVYPPGLAFATGVIVGAAIWGNCGWGRGDITININNYNKVNHTNISSGNWNHSTEHRKGVAYQDQGVAQKYNRGANAQATQSREEFRGRADQGRQEVAGMDKSQLQSRGQQADRGGAAAPSAGTLDAGGSARGGAPSPSTGSLDVGGASPGGGSGLSGVGTGASTREASAQGGASRSGGSMSRSGGSRR